MAKAAAIPAEVEADFARFWAAYPRRPGDARHMALVNFAKLVKGGVPAEALIASAGVYAKHIADSAIAPTFIQQAKTWLNQRRFEDFPAPAPSAPGPEGPDDHPLAWLRAGMSEGDFRAWILPLRVENRDGALCIIARTSLARDRVRNAWGRAIAEQLGEVSWIVERTPQP